VTCCKSGHSVTFYSPNTNNGVDCRGPIQQINTGDCFRATRKLRNYRFRTSGSYYRVGETRNLDEGSLLNHGRRRWTCMAFSDQSSVQMPRGKSLYQVMTGTRLHWWHLLGLFKQKQKNELGLKKTVKFLTLNPKSRESCVIKSNNFSRNWTTINSSRKHKFVATTTVPHSQSTSYNPTNNDNCHNASELNEKGCQTRRS
jgi:hypothetical protein